MVDADVTTRMAARAAQRRMALVLLPLRVFLGLAWLRSGLGKVTDPSWSDGAALTGFLHGQLDAATQPIPGYAAVMEALWMRVAAPLGVTVAVTEIVVGLALLTGTATTLALVIALTLNLNFMLSGAVAPSHLYVVAQVVLLIGGAGSHASVDRYLSLAVPGRWVCARSSLLDDPPSPKALTAATIVCTSGAVAAAPQVQALLPNRGVDDPALLTVVVLLLLAGVSATLAVRSRRLAARHRRFAVRDRRAAVHHRLAAQGVVDTMEEPAPVGTADTGAAPAARGYPAAVETAPSVHRPAVVEATPWVHGSSPTGDAAPSVHGPLAPDTARPARRDQPTQIFVRSRPGRPRPSVPAPDHSDDLYAELRDLQRVP